ncbi:hypothetical protein CDD83_5469 [Cordyceps sp. RAO-2017]|nr:hypothetical protein CDD83_5469 [Cordyceps sp. RAO-2017]
MKAAIKTTTTTCHRLGCHDRFLLLRHHHHHHLRPQPRQQSFSTTAAAQSKMATTDKPPGPSSKITDWVPAGDASGEFKRQASAPAATTSTSATRARGRAGR